MKSLEIKKTKQTPKISCNYDLGKIEILGRSRPENTTEIYSQLYDWVTEYVKKPQPKTTVNLDFDYINSSSNKFFFSLLKKLEIIKNNGKEIKINWFYEESDEDIYLQGIDFSNLLDLEFQTQKK